MKKVIFTLILLIIFLITSLITVLISTGVETNKFNNLISKKIEENNQNISLEFKKIKFKFDIKNFSLFLNTNDPIIYYKEVKIPLKNIKVYLDLIPLIKSQPKIEKIVFLSNELDIDELKKITFKLKPSNITGIINNKIESGKVKTELEIYLTENQELKNFIAKGSARKVGVSIQKIKLENIKFDFSSIKATF